MDSVLDVCAAVVKLNASAKAKRQSCERIDLSHFFSFNDRAESENLEEKPFLGAKQRGERLPVGKVYGLDSWPARRAVRL